MPPAKGTAALKDATVEGVRVYRVWQDSMAIITRCAAVGYLPRGMPRGSDKTDKPNLVGAATRSVAKHVPEKLATHLISQ